MIREGVVFLDQNDEEKITTEELEDYKTFFEECVYPEMEWKCDCCTFLNIPNNFTCAMCSTKRQVELPRNKVLRLEKLLSVPQVSAEEKEELSNWEEKPKSPVDQLKDLSKKYAGVTQKVELLEEANWQLTDRLVKVE